MSLVTQIVSRFDLNIDKRIVKGRPKQEPSNTSHVRNIRGTARALSVDSHGLLTRHKLLDLLHKGQFSSTPDEGAIHEQTWFVVAKLTSQTMGIVLNMLLEHSSLIGDEIVYWDDVLGSSLQTGYYTLQTGPSRVWLGASNILAKVKTACIQENLTSFQGIAGNWRPFYQTVRRNVHRGLSERTRKTLSSPFSLCRLNIRQKQQALEIQKKLYASAIGILLQECLTLASNEHATDTPVMPHPQWCARIYKIALLMEIALENISEPLMSSTKFEDGIFHAVENKFQGKQSQLLEEPSFDVADVMESLTCVLQSRVPFNAAFNNTLIKQHGRPSVFARYWLPTAVTLMSLTTSLRILTNRKAELMTWFSEFGSTIIDFWGNWVLQPVQKLIGTIRHDEQSEIAIMSRNSLEADWRSLERMVVDFVSDHSSQTNGSLQENVKTITAQVREGDLTPVLRAYERDLRKPFMGTVRGDLVRALLIQIQKTKVDVEVAIGGIDALLKSQELVFGFIGLTPGLLITYGVVRWIAGLFDRRKGFRAGIEKQQFRRAVRNIDRILGAYSSTPNGVLSYEDYGLCIYEAHILKQRAQYTLPRSVLPMFQQDLTDLTDLSHGVSRQRSVVHRIQWMYSKWI